MLVPGYSEYGMYTLLYNVPQSLPETTETETSPTPKSEQEYVTKRQPEPLRLHGAAHTKPARLQDGLP